MRQNYCSNANWSYSFLHELANKCAGRQYFHSSKLEDKFENFSYTVVLFYFTVIEKACRIWGTIGQCSVNNRSWLHEWFHLNLIPSESESDYMSDSIFSSESGQFILFELRKHVCENLLFWSAFKPCLIQVFVFFLRDILM